MGRQKGLYPAFPPLPCTDSSFRADAKCRSSSWRHTASGGGSEKRQRPRARPCHRHSSTPSFSGITTDSTNLDLCCFSQQKLFMILVYSSYQEGVQNQLLTNPLVPLNLLFDAVCQNSEVFQLTLVTSAPWSNGMTTTKFHLPLSFLLSIFFDQRGVPAQIHT